MAGDKVDPVPELRTQVVRRARKHLGYMAKHGEVVAGGGASERYEQGSREPQWLWQLHEEFPQETRPEALAQGLGENE